MNFFTPVKPAKPRFGMGIYTSFRLGSVLRHSYAFRPYIDLWQSSVFISADLKAVSIKDRFGRLPETKCPIVFAMVGLPQVGKSTIAKAFTDTIGAVIVEDNALRNYLQKKNFGDFPYISEVNLLMLDIALSYGKNVAFDSDFSDSLNFILIIFPEFVLGKLSINSIILG